MNEFLVAPEKVVHFRNELHPQPTGSNNGVGVGACSADLSVILVVTGSIYHSKAYNVKHILPQSDQSQAAWTTKCSVM